MPKSAFRIDPTDRTLNDKSWFIHPPTVLNNQMHKGLYVQHHMQHMLSFYAFGYSIMCVKDKPALIIQGYK